MELVAMNSQNLALQKIMMAVEYIITINNVLPRKIYNLD